MFPFLVLLVIAGSRHGIRLRCRIYPLACVLLAYASPGNAAFLVARRILALAPEQRGAWADALEQLRTILMYLQHVPSAR